MSTMRQLTAALATAAVAAVALVAVALGGIVAAPPAAAATVVGPGTYEESSPAIGYSAAWTTLSSSGSSRSGIRYSTSSSAKASLTFTGAAIAWYTWKSPSAGIVHVYVDGARVATVDNYARTTRTVELGYRATLKPGTHTIEIRASGSKNAASIGRITHLDSFVVGVDRSRATLAAPQGRASACPAATVTVSSSRQLSSALAAARPGSVIRLAAGTYTGAFELTAAGTATTPIWVCGTSDAVIEGESPSTGTAFRLDGAAHVRLAGFTVARALQGVMVKRSTHVSVSDLIVKDIGYEGIHLYAFTTDSTVTHNTIVRTGSLDVAFGEGIYIGTSQRRWAEVTGGVPDRSDRNTITYNTIKSAGSESIEAKEGTSGGTIAFNTFEGHRSGSRAMAWVAVTGSDWIVARNQGEDAVQHGYASMTWSEWGYDNLFTGNTGIPSSSGYGVWVQQKDRRVDVACDNDIEAAKGFTNVFCGP